MPTSSIYERTAAVGDQSCDDGSNADSVSLRSCTSAATSLLDSAARGDHRHAPRKAASAQPLDEFATGESPTHYVSPHEPIDYEPETALIAASARHAPNYRTCETADSEARGTPQPLPDPLNLRRHRMDEREVEELCRSRQRSKRRLGEFYAAQNELIDELLSPVGATEAGRREAALMERRVKVAIYGSVVANVVLLILQLVAAIASGSLSLFATMADAFMDLLSGVILMLASREASKENFQSYPTGKSRMETIGIIVFSALMSTVSVQLIVESFRALASDAHESQLPLISIVFVCIALVTKFGLYVYCSALRENPSAAILAQDHYNDLIVNVFGLSMSLLGNQLTWWLDPVGAVAVALLILRSWTMTAFEQIQLIIGKSADPAFIKRVIYIAFTHHEDVVEVDTAQAYHVGSNVYVEVDIVMDRLATLQHTHDVGESLQMKLESLPNVERAFVHVDYESKHQPEHRKMR